MPDMFPYSKAAMERAMKIQEVILRAMAKKITWWQAAEILGFSDRHLRRIRERYEEFGYESMVDKRRGQPSPKRVPLATVEKVLALYREKYFDFNVRHFHEKLREQHEVDLSYTWAKSVLQGAGQVARQRQRGVHRKRRPRRPLPGMWSGWSSVVMADMELLLRQSSAVSCLKCELGKGERPRGREFYTRPKPSADFGP